MLVYQLMPSDYALENLKRRRLKVSLLDDLNDPFELIGAEERSPELRSKMSAWRAHMASVARLLCFSKRFTNPVLWSHYADKHKGMALGFDIPNGDLTEVHYASARLQLDLEREAARPEGVSREHVQALLRTKFEDWRYEEEVRMFLRPEDVVQEGSHQFHSFSSSLKLRRVLIGPRCKVSQRQVQALLRPEDSGAKVFHTRLAFQSYRVIRTPYEARQG